MLTKLIKSIFGIKKTNVNKTPNGDQDFSGPQLPGRSENSTMGTLIRAQKQGRALLLERKNGIYLSAIPIDIDNNSAILINDESRKIIKLDIKEVKVLQESYFLEQESTVKANLENIANRGSDNIEEIEYWDEKLNSIYDEDMVFISESDSYIQIRDPVTGKFCKIRKPFIRSIIFEGQRNREIIQRVNQLPSKYEGYECFNVATAMMAGKRYDQIASGSDFDTILSLLSKAINDQSISTNTRASASRFLGEIFEAKNDSRTAIKYYENALSLNEKIGLKKKLAKLKSLEIQNKLSPL